RRPDSTAMRRQPWCVFIPVTFRRGRALNADAQWRPASRQAPILSRPSAPHEAFALTFSPGEHLFHGFALVITQAHLGQGRLRIDLLCDLWRGGRRGDRKRLVVVRVRIVVERALRRPFLLPD